jgi:hypothetical protein
LSYRQIRISDLSGEVVPDEEVVAVVVRHPDLEEARSFDAAPAELEDLKPLEGLVEVELKSSSGTTTTLMLNRDDFEAVVPLEKLQTFSGTRGRRLGYSPRANGS